MWRDDNQRRPDGLETYGCAVVPEVRVARMSAAETEWEPGDPLPGWHRRAPHQGFLYNFRECEYSENCSCADRASWPEPLWSHDLSRWPDELEKFIAEYHEWKANG
jgi:hypothetical protein